MKFGVRNHILGLFGIVILIFFILFNSFWIYYIRSYSERFILLINILIFLVGFSLLMAEFLPERIKNSLGSFPLKQNIDRIIPKYGIFLLGFLILIGFYLRFNNLNNLSFWADELYTTYAAIGLMQNGSPVMPSGMLYNRSILNTFLIAKSFETFGVSEFSARIVSVIFGTLTIPLVYSMGTKLVNRRVGLLAAVLITFSIWEIIWSRQARMYAQFQFLYLLTSYLFYLGINKSDFRILLFSGIAFFTAYLSHIQALLFLPVAVIYILIFKCKLLNNKYFIYGSVTTFGVALIYIILVIGKRPINYFFQNAPIWAQKPFYFYAFAPDLIILFFLVAISVTISIILWRVGLLKDNGDNSYILLNFFIPFLILSVYLWKDPRYAFFIFPFLIISASSAIDFYGLQNAIDVGLCSRISDVFKLKIELVRNIKFAILFMMIMLLFVQIFFSINSLNVSQSEHGNTNGLIFSNWKKGSEYVKNKLSEDDKIISTLPVASLYYLGKVDYYLRQNEYKAILSNEGKLVDIRTEVPILNTYDSFMEIIKNSHGWVIVDYRIDTYFVDTEVRDYIRNNMTFHPDGSDSTIEVYSWNVSQ